MSHDGSKIITYTQKINNACFEKTERAYNYYIALALVVVVLAGLFFIGQSKNKISWDALPYAAIALGYSEVDKEKIHKTVYDYVRSYSTEEEFEQGILNNQHKINALNNHEVFYNQMPWYTSKPLYPLLMKVFMYAGFDPIRSGLLVAGISFFICGLVAFLWLSKLINPYASFLIVGSLFTSSEIFNLTRYVSTDMLSSLFVVLSFYFYVIKKNVKISFLLMVISIAARPDNIIYLFLLAPATAIYRIDSIKTSSLFMLIGFLLYYLETSMSGHYGWQTHFYHSFVERLDDPASFVSHLSLMDYIKVYAEQLISMILSSDLGAYLIIILSGLMLTFRSDQDSNVMRVTYLVLLSYMVMHIAVFPGEKERLFATLFLLLILMLITSIAYSRSMNRGEMETE